MSVVLPVPQVPTISRERLCMSRGTTTRPCLSVQPRSPSTWTPRATGPKWSSRTAAARRTAESIRRVASRCCLLDLGRVDGLAAAGQVRARRPAGRPGWPGGAGATGTPRASGSRAGRRRSAAASRCSRRSAGPGPAPGHPRPAITAAMAAREARASFHQRRPVTRSNAWPAAQASRVTGLSRNRARATPMVSWPAAGGPPVGRRWPSWLSYSGRPGCPQPQVGRWRPQRGSCGGQPPQLRGSSGCQLTRHHPWPACR